MQCPNDVGHVVITKIVVVSLPSGFYDSGMIGMPRHKWYDGQKTRHMWSCWRKKINWLKNTHVQYLLPNLVVFSSFCILFCMLYIFYTYLSGLLDGNSSSPLQAPSLAFYSMSSPTMGEGLLWGQNYFFSLCHLPWGCLHNKFKLQNYTFSKKYKIYLI